MLAAALLCGAWSGCAAWTNPVAKGIPVRAVPPELLAEPKEYKETIPLVYLRQKPAEVYLLGPNDVLGVYIEGVLENATQAPPVNFYEGANAPPSVGYPIPVRDDGTISLPLVPPILVKGLSLAQAEAAIIEAYTVKTNIVQAGRARIIVTLARPRQTRVLVIRQDSPTGRLVVQTGRRGLNTSRVLGGAEAMVGGQRHGTGTIVDLPADENDVLNALAQTGGLPGLDAANEVIIERGHLKTAEDIARLAENGGVRHLPSPAVTVDPMGGEIVRIPLRLSPCVPPPFRPEDMILHPGDVVFIEARDTEVFYAGGLLPPGEYPLPRDYDLDVVEAVAQIGGPMVNGGLNNNNLSGALIAPGIGAPSPKLVTVVRRTPGGGQVPIIVNLHLALRDPSENLLLRPGDVVILQETCDQALVRYFTQVFQFQHLLRRRQDQPDHRNDHDRSAVRS